MALLRAKWFVMGVPVGFWWGWKKSYEWEMEKVVESVLPGPVAKHVVDFLPKGTADTRHKVRLQESIMESGRRQEEAIREAIRKQEEATRSLDEKAARQEEAIQKQKEITMLSLEENAARQEYMIRQLAQLQAVVARLPKAEEQRLAQTQGSPPTTTAAAAVAAVVEAAVSPSS